MKCPDCCVEMEVIDPRINLYRCGLDGIFQIYTEDQLIEISKQMTETELNVFQGFADKVISNKKVIR